MSTRLPELGSDAGGGGRHLGTHQGDGLMGNWCPCVKMLLFVNLVLITTRGGGIAVTSSCGGQHTLVSCTAQYLPFPRLEPPSSTLVDPFYFHEENLPPLASNRKVNAPPLTL